MFKPREKIRVLIADDHAIVREGAVLIINNQIDMEVVGEAQCGNDVVPLARELQPDVIILDISMPDITGIELVPYLRKEAPKAQITLLSMHNKEIFVQQALESGARGYVLKTSPTSDLLSAVRAVYAGEYYLSSKVQARVIGSYLRHPFDEKVEKSVRLTEREMQVLLLVAQGQSTKEVANTLYLSSRTVDKYRASFMQKLGLKTHNELLRYAITEGHIIVE